jgi:HPr kinase/phosphorylase
VDTAWWPTMRWISYRIAQTALVGRCPELLANLLEVRGIGLLDIKAIFGETAVRRKMRLKLIVHLVRRETMEREFERLPYEPLYEDMLGVPGAQGGDRRWTLAATWRCWWRRPCATPSCNCAASTPTRNSSRATSARWSTVQDEL